MSRKLVAKFLGTFWLFWVAPVAAGLVHGWLGAEDSEAGRGAAAWQAAALLGEALAPATAREPR